MERTVPGGTERHLKNKAIRGKLKGKSCLGNFISFCDKVTCLVDEGKTVDIIFLYFSKALITILHSVLLDKLSNCEINRFMLR